jgi:hypothetical protein
MQFNVLLCTIPHFHNIFFIFNAFFLIRREVKNKKNGIINNEKKLNKIFATK